ncbi:hypothetical protein ABIF68_009343 [Bradyrhizobium japonicum]|uniref:hypothetical protein n=1 Tax=Bradyrhizobium TaxID=374 RepID=UPI0012FE32F1|nr:MULTISPECIES: hypothetical protein [Bradyrhizobium]MBR0947365.1 hypothetical protein [Bradyrhizobium liaoningense]MDI2074733.1 hypothetical protein [Bradyrhizobium sp. Mp27]
MNALFIAYSNTNDNKFDIPAATGPSCGKLLQRLKTRSAQPIADPQANFGLPGLAHQFVAPGAGRKQLAC